MGLQMLYCNKNLR